MVRQSFPFSLHQGNVAVEKFIRQALLYDLFREHAFDKIMRRFGEIGRVHLHVLPGVHPSTSSTQGSSNSFLSNLEAAEMQQNVSLARSRSPLALQNERDDRISTTSREERIYLLYCFLLFFVWKRNPARDRLRCDFFLKKSKRSVFLLLIFWYKRVCGLIELFVLSWKKKTFIDAYNFSF